jgi:hypothetical protein
LSTFGAVVLLLCLGVALATWGTEWALSSLIVAIFTVVMEWVRPFIADNDIDGKPRNRR